MLVTTIFILILFLPGVFLPVVLDAFASSTDLDEMGISLENSGDPFLMQGTGLMRCSRSQQVSNNFKHVGNLSALSHYPNGQ